jgi:hypothetical protein
MAYAYRGSGYLSNAVQGTGTAPYLFTSGGYSGSTTELGVDGIGTRILADGGTIESTYSPCVTNALGKLRAIGSSELAANALFASAISDGAIIEAKQCFYNSYIELQNIDIR